MWGRNNLGKGLYNTYWKVSRGFKVYARIGHLDEERERGPLDHLIPVYQEVKLKSGDQIHDLHGGVYVIFKAGGGRQIRIKMGLGKKDEEVYPESCLKRITKEESTHPGIYRTDEFHTFFTLTQINELGLHLDT